MKPENTDSWRVYEGSCKDCGERFHFSESAMQGDVLRGLSAPSRCPQCRERNRKSINARGVSYWRVPYEFDDRKRAWGHFGLGRVDRPAGPPKPIEYPGTPNPELLTKFAPFDPVVQKLIANLESPYGKKVSVLVGPTGTGKSVWATYRMLRSNVTQIGPICVTQPRLITLRGSEDAAEDSTTPGFIAKHLLRAPGLGQGHEVGFRYRGEAGMQDRYTRLLFVTDGLLIQWVLSGEIRRFSVIVIDEAHEQSRNMELLFALLRHKLALYPKLRLVIASATVDVEKFQNYFGNGDPSQVFVAQPEAAAQTPRQVHDRWPDIGEPSYAGMLSGFKIPETEDEIPEAVARVVYGICHVPKFTFLGKSNGDIVAFVPTVKLASKTVDAIRALRIKKLEALVCHAQMTREENEAFRQSEKNAEAAFRAGTATPIQRVIVATNYAETSVTMANLVYVIDSGLILEPNWNPRTCSTDYRTQRHSKAGCWQRRGRVGRVQDGEVFHLYPYKDFLNPQVFSPNPRPEISRAPLDQFLLAAKAAGIDDLETFDWMGFDKADTSQVAEKSRALQVLKKANAIDRDGDITSRGLELSRLQTSSVDLALFFSESDAFGCTLEVATFLAFTNQQRRVFGFGEKGALAYARLAERCQDDLEFYLLLFTHWKRAGVGRSKRDHERWSEEQGLNHQALLDVDKSRAEALKPFLYRTHTSVTERELDIKRLHRVRVVLAKALPEWLYRRASANPGATRWFTPVYPDRCPCSQQVYIDRDSSCAGADIRNFICIERQERGSVLYAQHVVAVDPEWIPAIERGKRLELAKMLQSYSIGGSVRRTLDEFVSSAGGATETQASSFAVVVSSHPIGETVVFCVKRFVENKDGSDSRRIVATGKNGQVVLLEFDSELRARVGANVRARIAGYGVAERTLKVTQKGVVAEYKAGQVCKAEVLAERRNMRSDEVWAWIVQLEPGVTGELNRREFGRDTSRADALRISHVLDVEIRNVSTTPLELRVPRPPLVVGRTTVGIVTGFLLGDDNSTRLAAFVELEPGIDGFLHRNQCNQRWLQAAEKGSQVKVQVTAITEQRGKKKFSLRAV